MIGPDTPQEPTAEQPGGSRRPSPRPAGAPVSPTSRARRAAAAGVDAGLRRPSPGPKADPGASARAGAQATGATLLTEPGDRAEQPAHTEQPAQTGPAATSQPVPDQDGDQARVAHRVRARAPRWLAIVLAVLVVALGATSGWLATARSQSGSVSQRDQALSAAKSSVPLILSYNYQSIDAGMAKAEAQLTGRARSDYLTAMTKSIKPAASKVKAVVQAQTDSAGVETVSADGDQVTVIVFGEQKVSNTSLSAPRTDIFRVRATMNLVNGHWLVSKFDQI